MAEHVTKEQIIDWFRPYGHFDKPIPFETLVSDLRGMKSADVEPVKRGRWVKDGEVVVCSECGEEHAWDEYRATYCENCGAKMDLEGNT